MMEIFDSRKLIGKKFNRIYRAADMLGLTLGENIKVIIRGTERIRAEFVFHVQTQWRFVKENKILLASGDIYEPFDENVPDDWDYDLFGRAKEESSIFDVLTSTMNEFLRERVVTDCYVSDFGDLHITFSDGTYFETFNPTSRKREIWRLIDYTTYEHIVVFDEE